MSTLRSRVIKLAHAHPELRPHLLPLLKQSKVEDVSERFVATQRGRNHDGSPNFAVIDQYPPLGSDGHSLDTDSMAKAQQGADSRNRVWVQELKKNRDKGLDWLMLPHRPGFYAFLKPLPDYESYID